MMLEVCNVSGGYGHRAVLEGISFNVSEGEVVGVLGANGSGKTTLFRTILQFLPLLGGSVLLNGQDASRMRPREIARAMSYIPQNYAGVFSYTVEEMVMMGRACHIPMFGVPGPEDVRAVHEALETLHISELAQRRFSEISGGQQRLAMIARALSQNARILVMDEPSADLDYANQQLVQSTIDALRTRGLGIVFSTHAPEHPYAVASKVLLLKNGRVVSSGPPADALTPATLSEAFGVPMDVVCVRDSSGRERRLCLPISVP